MCSDNNILPLKVKLLKGSNSEDKPKVSLPDCDFDDYHKGLQLFVFDWLLYNQEPFVHYTGRAIVIL